MRLEERGLWARSVSSLLYVHVRRFSKQSGSVLLLSDMPVTQSFISSAAPS